MSIKSGSCRGSLAQRFWRKVNKCGPTPTHRPDLGACWLWTGHRMKPFGHGQLGVGGRGAGLILAHRASWWIHHSVLPAGVCVCHKCDNGSCVNPAHLFLGSRAENNRDMAVKNRSGRSKLSPPDVLEIRRLRETTNLTLSALGSRFGVGMSTISAVVNNQNWSWL